jgi:predicted permease
MEQVFLLATVLITAGVLWRRFEPFGISPDTVRRTLSAVVYNLLLPALVLGALWHASLTADMLRVSLVAVVDVTVGFALAWVSCRVCRQSQATTGALMLAAAFGNVTYLGLPVLEASLGTWARAVAVQYDFFGTTPLLFTLGILVARHFGTDGGGGTPLRTLLASPPLWAAVAAVLLNAAGVPLPAWLARLLDRLAAGVAPLMLLVVGLSLVFRRDMKSQFPSLLPVVLIQLVIMPLLIWGLTVPLGIAGELRTAVVLEAAMPAMVLGIVLSERYGLDTGRYAQAVTVTTLLSMLTLPAWFALVGE